MHNLIRILCELALLSSQSRGCNVHFLNFSLLQSGSLDREFLFLSSDSQLVIELLPYEEFQSFKSIKKRMNKDKKSIANVFGLFFKNNSLLFSIHSYFAYIFFEYKSLFLYKNIYFYHLP